MANESIGRIKCPITGAQAEIREAKRGKYPLYYYSRESGIIHGKTPEFERFIKENGKFDQTAPEQPEEEQKPEKETGVFDWLLGGDDD